MKKENVITFVGFFIICMLAAAGIIFISSSAKAHDVVDPVPKAAVVVDSAADAAVAAAEEAAEEAVAPGWWVSLEGVDCTKVPFSDTRFVCTKTEVVAPAAEKVVVEWVEPVPAK